MYITMHENSHNYFSMNKWKTSSTNPQIRTVWYNQLEKLRKTMRSLSYSSY